MTKIPNCFYRVSVKAFVTNKEGHFLLQKERRGVWDLPGGGLDFGENPTEGLKREIKEEMGLDVDSVELRPAYFITANDKKSLNPNNTGAGVWKVNILYRVQISNIDDFVQSDECVEIKYFTADEVLTNSDVLENVKEFARVYNKLII